MYLLRNIYRIILSRLHVIIYPFNVVGPRSSACSIYSNYCAFCSYRPRLEPEPGQGQPPLTALAWPDISESPSRQKPGQSRGFEAKPGRNRVTTVGHSISRSCPCTIWIGLLVVTAASRISCYLDRNKLNGATWMKAGYSTLPAIYTKYIRSTWSHVRVLSTWDQSCENARTLWNGGIQVSQFRLLISNSSLIGLPPQTCSSRPVIPPLNTWGLGEIFENGAVTYGPKQLSL